MKGMKCAMTRMSRHSIQSLQVRLLYFASVVLLSSWGLVGSGVLAGAITVCCYCYLLLLLLCVLVTCVAITITAPQVVWICCHGGD